MVWFHLAGLTASPVRRIPDGRLGTGSDTKKRSAERDLQDCQIIWQVCKQQDVANQQ